jgi:hypothetical protein
MIKPMRKKRTTKKEIYTHSINCKVTDKQYNDLKAIKKISGISISEMMRNNIAFLLAYHKPKA